MKRIKFYVCPNCGNVLNSTGDAQISCCGRKLEALSAKQEDENHQINLSVIEDDYYITLDHEMSKNHFISFIAYATYNKILLIKLYPEQNAEVRFPKMHGGNLYVFCNNDGLFIKNK